MFWNTKSVLTNGKKIDRTEPIKFKDSNRGVPTVELQVFITRVVMSKI